MNSRIIAGLLGFIAVEQAYQIYAQANFGRELMEQSKRYDMTDIKVIRQNTDYLREFAQKVDNGVASAMNQTIQREREFFGTQQFLPGTAPTHKR